MPLGSSNDWRYALRVRVCCAEQGRCSSATSIGLNFPMARDSGRGISIGMPNCPEADFWKVSGIPLVRLKLHREVTATVKLAVQEQE